MILAYQRPWAVAVQLQSQITVTRRRRRKFVLSMDNNLTTNNNPQTKDYLHYNHTDSCNASRWTARESYVFMYARPWEKVVNFYSNLVNGQTALHHLFGTKSQNIYDNAVVEPSEYVVTPAQKRAGRWARMNFKIVMSYHGGSFDGWQKQPGLNTVQEVVEKSLGKFVDERKAGLLKDKGLPLEGNVVVAGRTDKGVTGFQQVCSFYTWREDVRPEDIEDAINSILPGKLMVISVSKVPRTFHPNFSAKWRRYMYIFPLNAGETGEEDATITYDGKTSDQKFNFNDTIIEENLESPIDDDKNDAESIKKPTRFKVSKVNKILQQLEGKLLSYKMFARDTKPARNTGPPTECFIFHARATQVTLPIDAEKGEYLETMCIELVANRFLRKMVRVLVATSIREAAAGADDDALIKLMDATCRRATAPPAPPDGLCLVDVGYNDFDSQTSFIL
ncbi:putative tRNA pseudouridine(38-40) synthase [Helianthus annuus]|uniref:tRNA pseudouridine synthase n=1 Tax=Helianthus annuus TaxID=4232 RepID=A0A251TMR6_HELAN|nr:tRNA pseudouridine synthase A [Helianthus annuus]KAF5787689.1 putative tRNA pseudouridine(38-40) synthase [Helianthus annuus]KAJ0514895.1 putative tRNA pseudouridine(38-40) synthase [Helianthus annuus]KAJ0531059.1 putative tRNA pseudouridine(38-40) synthase [Helianthus annuus]KAJ0697907.1 putative tRNA pseudouridine(38-40) synthase [Helianthus annuus]KAJ0701271.1 putative tRNA pseudouridine(38-40) synthase [Helianthus annuus]